MATGGADSVEAAVIATEDAMVHDVTSTDAPTPTEEKQINEGDGTKTQTKRYVVVLFEFSVVHVTVAISTSLHCITADSFVHVSCQQLRHCVSCVMTARWRSGATTVNSGCAHSASEVI